MAINVSGFGGVVQEVEANTRAARVSLRPDDIGSLGSYRLAVFSGLTTGLAAAAPVFAFRWSDATRLALIRRVTVQAQVVTGFTAQQEIATEVFIARAWSAADTAGTAIVLTGNNNKKQTSMGSSLVGVNDVRVATAAALTAGTRTLDANPVANMAALELAALGTVPRASLNMDWDMTNGVRPQTLVTNEGFIVRNTIAQGAGGTVRWAISVAWDEVAAYS